MVAALLAPASASATPSTARIIVQHEPGVSGDEQKEIRADVDATLVDTLRVPRTEVIEVPRRELSSALRTLNRDSHVTVAEEDRVVRAFSDDPEFTKLWGLESTGQTIQGQFATYRVPRFLDINAPEAWSMSRGTDWMVAVVDSGVYGAHADFTGRVGAGYDWVDEDNVPNDLSGHGTHVAGTIAAAADNGVGIAGVAPESRILPLRVLNAQGEGLLSDIIEAFDFAGDQGVRVVNASLGGATKSALEEQVIEAHPDTLYVAAAGNSGKDVDVPANAQYPCAFDSPNVLCVGAFWPEDNRLPNSNYGSTAVDVFAPGYDIYSTTPSGTYAFMSGTSMAAPHVAGVAALMLARNPGLTAGELKTRILATAQQSLREPFAYDESVSEGRLDAEAAVGSVFPDRDGDSIEDDQDNCPDVPNTDQTDSNDDDIGDACEPDAQPLDTDADGLVDPSDNCPQEAGTVRAQGCPGAATDSNHDGLPDMFDADGDGVSNSDDNCPSRSNRDQADADRDRIGNVCDSTPRGPDADGDGRPLLDDRCPTVYARTATGCPVPPPPVVKDSDGDGRKDNADACPYERALGTLNGCPLPAVTALTAKPRKRGGKRYASIAVRTSRGATVRLVVQRKVGRRWRKVTTTVRTTSTKNRVTLKTKRLKRGRYRVRVVVSSAAGSAPTVTKAFRVR